MQYDICVVGSGAGAGPVIYELAKAGYAVLVLEKGPWIKTEQFTKDEITATRRSVYTPNLQDEQHVFEQRDNKGNWIAKAGFDIGQDFWNGSCVGGSSNFMSGYFHRLKPNDFRLLSTYGNIEGANLTDWPISYQELEPYYTKVEHVVGVSGTQRRHSQLEPRSEADFPYPPLAENAVSAWLDKTAAKLDYEMLVTPRAILSQAKAKRNACVYSNYCGSYACSSDAKGSARAALIDLALETGNCSLVPDAKVFKLETDQHRKVKKAWYYNKQGQPVSAQAKVFVVAAQAIETARLLLMSQDKKFPNGLANNNGQVGKNLIFSGGGVGSGIIDKKALSDEAFEQIMVPGLFVNRSLHQWYEIDDPAFSDRKLKGGIIDILFEHPNGIAKALRQKWDENGKLVYGTALKEKLLDYFTQKRKLKFEVFVDWLPNNDCFVRLDNRVKDKWGDPVARLRTAYHKHDVKVGGYLAQKAETLFKQMGLQDVSSSISGSAPPNVVVGGCRFGHDSRTSVLDKNCKAHELDNLFVTDGSFFPNGGSVTPTFTIYANSFRVADVILAQLTR